MFLKQEKPWMDDFEGKKYFGSKNKFNIWRKYFEKYFEKVFNGYPCKNFTKKSFVYSFVSECKFVFMCSLRMTLNPLSEIQNKGLNNKHRP